MFKQFKNIDTAFQFVRLFAIIFLVCNVIICLYTVYRTTATVQKGQQKIYVLYNGKLMDAIATQRSDSLQVEIRDHVKMFHFYFYSLQPDEAVNKRHVTAALYLADNSARQEYNNLSENGYYTNIISANVSQEVLDYDSIQVDINHVPYSFRYFGKLRIIRATSVLTRSLITEGYVRMTDISDHNPHGMLIERWKVDDNKDLTLEKR
ncbi:MAG TPA: conjugative transposon protein TraK [Puia sp.]|uniref:conjugative transposon protein TraK n=1 Tax=Puia sp. TaxID=2045100 RepID=UPI002B9E6234|nr:conjugative transposon protein TraK [Puia sp.]HVU97743.1 conjugative transposon protein TraK [Puia sp.]